MTKQFGNLWFRAFLGVLIGGGLGFLLAYRAGYHLPIVVIEVPSIHGAGDSGKVDADLDPRKVEGASYVRRETIYATDPPVLRLHYRVRDGEAMVVSNQVASGFQRAVQVSRQAAEETHRLGVTVDAWGWILMGAALFGGLGFLLPLGNGPDTGLPTPDDGSPWMHGLGRAAVVALVVAVIVAFAVVVGLDGFGIWRFRDKPVGTVGGPEPAFRIEPAGPGRLMLHHSKGTPWRAWRGGASTAVPPRLLTLAPIRASNFVDAAALPGRSLYFFEEGVGEVRAPRGPGIEAWVLEPVQGFVARRGDERVVRLEWQSPSGPMPPYVTAGLSVCEAGGGFVPAGVIPAGATSQPHEGGRAHGSWWALPNRVRAVNARAGCGVKWGGS
jgi:hypothetical protein